MNVQPNEVLGAVITVVALLLLLWHGRYSRRKLLGQAYVVYWNRATGTEFRVPVREINHAQQFVNTLNLSTVSGITYFSSSGCAYQLGEAGIWLPNKS